MENKVFHGHFTIPKLLLVFEFLFVCKTVSLLGSYFSMKTDSLRYSYPYLFIIPNTNSLLTRMHPYVRVCVCPDVRMRVCPLRLYVCPYMCVHVCVCVHTRRNQNLFLFLLLFFSFSLIIFHLLLFINHGSFYCFFGTKSLEIHS